MNRIRNHARIASCVLACAIGSSFAQDWPQWRGPARDGKAAAFYAPKTWPKELIKKWSVRVGDGVSTPSLVGEKLYVFTRDQGAETASTETNRTYILQSAPDLSGGSWTPIRTNIATGSQLVLPNIPASGPMQFYRLVALQ